MSSRFDDNRSKSGLQPIGGALQDLLHKMGLDERLRERELLSGWSEIVGPDIAAHVSALDIQDGVLILAADHGAWRQEVNMLAPQILAKLAAKLGKGVVKDLKWHDRPGIRRKGADA